MLSTFLTGPMVGSIFPVSKGPLAYRLAQGIFGTANKKVVSKDVASTEIPTAAAGNGNTRTGSPSGLVNPLGESLNTSNADLDSRLRQHSSNGSSGVSSVKPHCEIRNLRVGKNNNEDWAYILAGIDREREKKYGEVIYEHIIYPADVIHTETVGRAKWRFLAVEKLPPVAEDRERYSRFGNTRWGYYCANAFCRDHTGCYN